MRNTQPLRITVLLWLPLFLVVSQAVAQEISVEKLVTEHVLPALKAIGEEQRATPDAKKPANADEATKRLDAAAWNLMLGEILAVNRGDLMLWTGAVDSLEDGLGSLDALEGADVAVRDSLISLDADTLAAADAETKAKLLEEQRRLTMKYDMVIARRDEIQKRLGLARDQEWSRLNQLRKLSIAYRDLVDGMAMADFYRQVGDLARAKTHLSASMTAAEGVTQVVDARKEFYLFEDEIRGNRADANEKYDFKLLSKQQRPLEIKLKPHIKALHAMALYRLATASSDLVPADTAFDDRKALLTKARDMAQEVTGEEGGGDTNAIASLASGWCELALGLLETSRAPQKDNAQAKTHFTAATASLQTAHRQLLATEGRDPTIDALAGRVQTALDRLGSPDWFLAYARKETIDGRPDNAYQILRQAALVHRSKEVWIAMLEAGLRAGFESSSLQSVFQDAVTTGLINERDEEGALLSARLTGATIWDRVSQVGISGIQTSPAQGEAKSELEKFREDLDRKKTLISTSLADTAKLVPGSVRRAQYQTMGVFLLHLTDMLSLDEGRPIVGSSEIQEFVRHVQDARKVLHTAIKASDDAWQTIGLRESRIQLYLAVGHLASRFLEKYNDDAMIAYMADRSPVLSWAAPL